MPEHFDELYKSYKSRNTPETPSWEPSADDIAGLATSWRLKSPSHDEIARRWQYQRRAESVASGRKDGSIVDGLDPDFDVDAMDRWSESITGQPIEGNEYRSR